MASCSLAWPTLAGKREGFGLGFHIKCTFGYIKYYITVSLQGSSLDNPYALVGNNEASFMNGISLFRTTITVYMYYI